MSLMKVHVKPGLIPGDMAPRILVMGNTFHCTPRNTRIIIPTR